MATYFQGGSFEQQNQDPVLQYLGKNNIEGARRWSDPYVHGQISAEEALAGLKGATSAIVPGGPIIDSGNGPTQGNFSVNLGLGTGFSMNGVNYGSAPINSKSIAPSATPQYVSPAPVAPYPVASIGSEYSPENYYALHPDAKPGYTDPNGLSTPETELSKRIKEIQGLTTEASGRAGYQAQQEEIQGIQDKQKLVNDLTNQLNLIKVEGQSIPLQSAGVNQTVGMLGAQEAEQQRQNAVKALTVFAQLQGAQGNLATAQQAADRATDLKYAPLEARIKAGLQNIELMRKDPELTVAEKNRLDASELRLKGLEDTKNQSKAITSQIMSILSDPEFQSNAPASVKKRISELAQKTTLTQAEAVEAANLGAKYKAAPKTSGTTGTTTDNTGSVVQSYLAKQGLPLTVASTNGELTTTALNKVVSAGIPIEVARGIWANMKAGNDFETIRAGMLAEFGRDKGYKLFDTFVQSLQGSSNDQAP